MKSIVKIWSGSAAVIIGIAIPAFGTSEASDAPDSSATSTAWPPSAAMPDASASAHDYQWFDHSVVNVHSTAHESDLPGSSIAEWGP